MERRPHEGPLCSRSAPPATSRGGRTICSGRHEESHQLRASASPLQLRAVARPGQRVRTAGRAGATSGSGTTGVRHTWARGDPAPGRRGLPDTRLGCRCGCSRMPLANACEPRVSSSSRRNARARPAALTSDVGRVGDDVAGMSTGLRSQGNMCSASYAGRRTELRRDRGDQTISRSQNACKSACFGHATICKGSCERP